MKAFPCNAWLVRQLVASGLCGYGFAVLSFHCHFPPPLLLTTWGRWMEASQPCLEHLCCCSPAPLAAELAGMEGAPRVDSISIPVTIATQVFPGPRAAELTRCVHKCSVRSPRACLRFWLKHLACLDCFHVTSYAQIHV